jgi:hypothetical protein
MLHAKEDAAYIYVFIRIMPALTIVIFTVTGNSVAIGKSPKRIISETAYTALILAVAQARNNLVDPMTA